MSTYAAILVLPSLPNLLILSNVLFQNVILGGNTLILTILLLLKTFLDFFRNYLLIYVSFHLFFTAKF